MIIGTSRNYAGRQVDLSIFPSQLQPGSPAIAEFSARPKAIAGPSRALQQFAIALLTPLGHYRSDPGYGSHFMPKVLSSELRLTTDLDFLFIKESKRVLEWIATNRPANTPSDEILDDVSMLSSDITRTSVAIVGLAMLRTSEPVNFLLPINWNPR